LFEKKNKRKKGRKEMRAKKSGIRQEKITADPTLQNACWTAVQLLLGQDVPTNRTREEKVQKTERRWLVIFQGKERRKGDMKKRHEKIFDD